MEKPATLGDSEHQRVRREPWSPEPPHCSTLGQGLVFPSGDSHSLMPRTVMGQTRAQWIVPQRSALSTVHAKPKALSSFGLEYLILVFIVWA